MPHRCKPPGHVKTRRTTQAPSTQSLWQSMRIMRAGFTIPGLVTVTDLNRDTVRKYVCALEKAGYLRRKVRSSGGYGGRGGVYDSFVLLRDTGPLAPIKRTSGNGVYDRNTGQGWTREGKPDTAPEGSQDASP